MKIGFISTMHGSVWGGSEELWSDAALLALAEGHEVCFSTHKPGILAPKVEQLEINGAKHFYHRPRWDSFWWRNISKVRRVVLGIREYFPAEKKSPFRLFFSEKPSVICLSQGDAYSFLLLPDLIEFINRTQLPCVLICQATINHIDLSDEERATMRGFFKIAYRVAFVANENLKTAERQIGAKIDNGIVLRNPVNIAPAEIVSWPQMESIRFASVATLDVVSKAQDVLFQALSGPEWRARNWQLSLYGSGRHEEYLRGLAEHYELQDKIVFVGHVSDVRAVWQENHLLVLPSRREGTPLALVEAMLCGRPSIVTDIAGMTEWIKDGETGFVAEAPSPNSVRHAMEKAWQNVARWKDMGENAHRFAIANYDPNAGQTLLNLLEAASNSGLKNE